MFIQWLENHKRVIQIIAVILLGLFVYILYMAITGRIPIYFATVCVLGLLGLYLFSKYTKVEDTKSIEDEEILKCQNCSAIFTRKQLEHSGECPLCHTDSYISTGRYLS